MLAAAQGDELEREGEEGADLVLGDRQGGRTEAGALELGGFLSTELEGWQVRDPEERGRSAYSPLRARTIAPISSQGVNERAPWPSGRLGRGRGLVGGRGRLAAEAGPLGLLLLRGHGSPARLGCHPELLAGRLAVPAAAGGGLWLDAGHRISVSGAPALASGSSVVEPSRPRYARVGGRGR